MYIYMWMCACVCVCVNVCVCVCVCVCVWKLEREKVDMPLNKETKPNLKKCLRTCSRKFKYLGGKNNLKIKILDHIFWPIRCAKNKRLLSSLGICRANVHMRDPHPNDIKSKHFQMHQRTVALSARQDGHNCVSESHSSPTHLTAGRTVSSYDRQLER